MMNISRVRHNHQDSIIECLIVDSTKETNVFDLVSCKSLCGLEVRSDLFW